jgi:hypothetical protein
MKIETFLGTSATSPEAVSLYNVSKTENVSQQAVQKVEEEPNVFST